MDSNTEGNGYGMSFGYLTIAFYKVVLLFNI